MSHIKYRLIAEVDEEVVYSETFDTTSEVQDSLHKAEQAVEDRILYDDLFPPTVPEEIGDV